MKRHTQARGGFTLIELLVTISIIAVVAGLIVGGTMAFRETMTNRATEDRFNRLQGALNKEYADVVQKGQNEKPPPEVLAYCAGDRDRAQAVHTAALLRTFLPETFAEATSAFNINGFVYQPKSTFKSVTGATGLTPDEESAVLLYLILTEQSVGGTSGDAVTVGETTLLKKGGTEFTVLVDSRGTPVAYRRWEDRSAELHAVPGDYAVKEPKTGSIDPLDPRLLVFTPATGWAGPAALNKNTAATDPNLKFNNKNRLPTLISYGKNKTFDNYAPGSDDIIGYRLNRYGKRGK